MTFEWKSNICISNFTQWYANLLWECVKITVIDWYEDILLYWLGVIH